MSIGERFKSLRGKKSLAELGDILGVTATQLSRIENDKSAPSLELASKICEHYGVTMDWLIRGVEPEAPHVESEQKPGYMSVSTEEYVAMQKKIIALQEQALEKKEQQLQEQQKQVARLKNDQ